MYAKMYCSREEHFKKDIIKLANNDASVKEITFKNLSAAQLGQLVRALQNNTVLTSLNFWQCKDVNLAHHVATILRSSHSIQHISINFCNIDPAGARNISTVLEDHLYLKELNLDYNVMGDEGLELLSNALQKNQSLKRLSISDNQIKDPGIKSLCAALKINNTLCELTLGFMHEFTSQTAMVEIRDMLQLNKSIVELRYNLQYYYHDEIEEYLKEQPIEQFLERNRAISRERENDDKLDAFLNRI